jgi:hypothetical protein
VDGDDFAFDNRRGRPATTTTKAAAGVITRLALGLGISALCLLALSPRLHWIYVSKPDKVQRQPDVFPVPDVSNVPDEVGLANIYLGEALISFDILYISLAVAALALVALMLTPTQQRDLADGAIAASGSAAVGWGVLVGLWQLGIAWRVFVVSSHFAEHQKIMGVRSQNASIYPGPGLGLGLLAAALVVIVFAVLVVTRKRFLWVLTAGALGFVLGLLILVLNVRPWQEIK